MLRAAAKNWQDVGVVIDPTDYPQVLAELADSKGTALTRKTKFMLAKKVFSHTAAYDGMISNYLTSLEAGSEEKTAEVPKREEYPAVFNLQLHKVQDMRYGENPHQSAAFYRKPRSPRACWPAGPRCRARSCPTTTSPTPTPPGNASRPSTCRPA
jgi:phosphoribosylaminoimidazolecarboxamide formyltransferase/IMP cyclohydrolase